MQSLIPVKPAMVGCCLLRHGTTSLAGTTDTPCKEYPLEPVASKQKLNLFSSNRSSVIQLRRLNRSDVLRRFAGLRPLRLQASKATPKEIPEAIKYWFQNQILFL